MISYGSQKINAETLCEKRSHQLGEGQSINTGMSGVVHSSHSFTRGQLRFAEMPFIERLLKEGSTQDRSNAR